MDKLSQKLEEKKATRLSSFHQGTFGIEKIDSTTLKPVLKSVNGVKCKGQGRSDEEQTLDAKQKADAKQKTDARLSILGYKLASKFEDLGGSHGESSFIAVVHIDGNAMGARVKDLYKKARSDRRTKWETFKQQWKRFSDSVVMILRTLI